MMVSSIVFVMVFILASIASESNGYPYQVYYPRKHTSLEQPLRFFRSHSSTSLDTPVESNPISYNFPSPSSSSPSSHLASISSSDSNVIEAVPNKRSAMLINKFMKDVQRAFEGSSSSDINGIPDSFQDDQTENKSTENEAAIKRKFSRCYLNAASCFY